MGFIKKKSKYLAGIRRFKEKVWLLKIPKRIVAMTKMKSSWSKSILDLQSTTKNNSHGQT
jgi:hypothetical protein